MLFWVTRWWWWLVGRLYFFRFGCVFVVFVMRACLAWLLAVWLVCVVRVLFCVRGLTGLVVWLAAWLSVASSVRCLLLLLLVRLCGYNACVLVLSSFVCHLCGQGPIGLLR